MKTELNPWVLAVVIGVVAVGLLIWGFKATQPGGYVPSPGAGGRPFDVPSYPGGGSAPAQPGGATTGTPAPSVSYPGR